MLETAARHCPHLWLKSFCLRQNENAPGDHA
jgi:hypothetical protein